MGIAIAIAGGVLAGAGAVGAYCLWKLNKAFNSW